MAGVFYHSFLGTFGRGLCMRIAPSLVLLFSFATLGCAHTKRTCPPNHLSTSARMVDLSAPYGTSRAVEPDIMAELLQQGQGATAGPSHPGTKQHRILALSGGGSNGAFTAG